MKILVIGYYHKNNLGDDSYQGVMGIFFPNDELDFIGSNKLSEIKAEKYNIVIVGGGDVINDYFNKDIKPFLLNFKGQKIAFSIGIPFPSLINDDYLGFFDHIFTRNYEDVYEIQKVLGSHRAHFIPDITLLYNTTSNNKNITSDSTFLSDNTDISGQIKKSEETNNLNQINKYKNMSKINKLEKTCGIFLIGNIIKYPNIVNDIAHIISKLALTYNIIFYCFDINEDIEISQIIKNLVINRLNNSETNNERLLNLLNDAKKYEHISIDMNYYNTSQMINLICNLDFAVCMRYHSHIFCTIAGVPFISISTTRKTRSYMKQAGLSKYQYETLLDCYGTPINSNYEELKSVCRECIHDKKLIRKQLSIFLNQSRFLLCSNQIKYLISINKTDIRIRIYDFIQETHDYENAARLLSNYIIGYPDSPYVWGMYGKFKRCNGSENNLRDIIYESAKYLMRNGAILKNETSDNTINDYINDIINNNSVLLEHDSFPLYVDLREYRSYKDAHRGGWYVACEGLHRLSSKNKNNEYNGIICDMYVDRTFHWTKSYMIHRGIIPYTGAWCGFIHHTANTTYSQYNTDSLFNIIEFIQSLHTCRALFTLSEPLSCYLRKRLETIAPHVKVITFYHPVVDPISYFDIDKYLINKTHKLINIGAWMRNPFTIYKINNIPNYQKAILVGKEMRDYIPPDNFKISYSELDKETLMSKSKNNDNDYISSLYPCRPEYNIMSKWLLMLIEWLESLGINIKFYDEPILYIEEQNRVDELNLKISRMLSSVKHLKYKSNKDYDKLLSKNIIFLDLIDAAAVNTIVECIVRKTPIIVNKIPGTIALLGENYPLFYTNLSQINDLLSTESIKTAYIYLTELNNTKFKLSEFMHQLGNIVNELVVNN